MLKIHLWRICLTTTVLALSVSIAAGAQLTRGFISGAVTDASNAILPGVQVTITHKATNISRQALTSDAGLYRFVAVEPGTYAIEFKLNGFATRRVDDIAVGTAQEVVVNQTMTVGGVTAEISVVDTPGIDLTKTEATIARNIPERVIQDLPLTAALRDVTRVALLAPTVTRAPGSNQFSPNGQRPT